MATGRIVARAKHLQHSRDENRDSLRNASTTSASRFSLPVAGTPPSLVLTWFDGDHVSTWATPAWVYGSACPSRWGGCWLGIPQLMISSARFSIGWRLWYHPPSDSVSGNANRVFTCAFCSRRAHVVGRALLPVRFSTGRSARPTLVAAAGRVRSYCAVSLGDPVAPPGPDA
jgi:hypothetical protein